MRAGSTPNFSFTPAAFRIALLLLSWALTVNAQSAIQAGCDFSHLAHVDLYGLSCPGCGDSSTCHASIALAE